MKRDMDLVRKILLAMEDAENPEAWASIREAPYSDEVIAFHRYLMGEAGLLKTMPFQGDTDRYPGADALHITWMGYEFLDAARDVSIWASAKEKVLNAGVGFSLDIVKAVLLTLAKEKLGL